MRSELVALLHRAPAEVADGDGRDPPRRTVLRFTGPGRVGADRVAGAGRRERGCSSDELSGAVHYIADGHHRVAASLAVWERAGRPADAGLMCAMYPLDGLRLLAFHRRVTGPVAPTSCSRLLSGDFDVARHRAPGRGHGLLRALRRRPLVRRGLPAATAPPASAGLDVAILNDHVLAPLLGSDAPAARVEIAPRSRRVDELTGPATRTAVPCSRCGRRPLEQLTEVADRGEVMPPKTTYFDPKPYAGIFLR